MLICSVLTILLSATPIPEAASGQKTIELARELLPDFRMRRSSRYAILSDADPTIVRRAESILHAAHHQYDRWCGRIGLDAPDPDARMLCVLFDDREQFVAFAERTEGLGSVAALCSGYFSPRFDWTVMFDPTDAEDYAAAVVSLEEAEQRVLEASETADPDRLQGARDQLDAAWADLDAAAQAARTAVAVHEAIHQLVHLTDAFPGRHHWPDWLHEGIAVAFETSSHRGTFGPSHDHPPRVEGFADAVRADRHLSLDALLTSGSIDHHQGEHTGVIYDQAGSLISWMSRRHRMDLRAFLQRAGVSDEHGDTPDLTVLFAETFGSPSRFERRWLAAAAR